MARASPLSGLGSSASTERQEGPGHGVERLAGVVLTACEQRTGEEDGAQVDLGRAACTVQAGGI